MVLLIYRRGTIPSLTSPRVSCCNVLKKLWRNMSDVYPQFHPIPSNSNGIVLLSQSKCPFGGLPHFKVYGHFICSLDRTGSNTIGSSHRPSNHRWRRWCRWRMPRTGCCCSGCPQGRPGHPQDGQSDEEKLQTSRASCNLRNSDNDINDARVNAS